MLLQSFVPRCVVCVVACLIQLAGDWESWSSLTDDAFKHGRSSIQYDQIAIDIGTAHLLNLIALINSFTL